MTTKKKSSTSRTKARRKRRSGAVSFPVLLASLGGRSYFDLQKQEKRLIRQAERNSILGIEAWSLIPHPDVLAVVRGSDGQVIRRILTIETLRAKIYSAVREFLTGFRVNVNSYFTGGSADFICDVQMTDSEWHRFYQELQTVLVTAGAGKIEELHNLTCVLRVDTPLVLGRRQLAEVGKPNSQILQRIQSEPFRFELVCQDVTSEKARKAFASERELKAYVKDLEEGRAIVGYRTLFDQCRFIDREYVPLCNGRALDNLLGQRKGRLDDILKPAVELLKVRPEQSADQAEREVTHVFINEYMSPGERHDWRCLVYDQLGDDLNLFTFPLEATVHESHLALSDLADHMLRARQYAGNMSLGVMSHPTSPGRPQKILLESAALAFQGMTIGQSGTGKTNTDCVLITEAAEKLRHIVVVDTKKSSSIREKDGDFPELVRSNITYHEFSPKPSTDEIATTLDKAFSAQGINVLEAPDSLLPKIFDQCLNRIEREKTNTGNKPRSLKGLLLVEEANDALGKDEDRQDRVQHLERVLTKASRKGWCIWLSTQHPSDVGYDNQSVSRILRALNNRIVHQIDKDDVSIVAALLHDHSDNGRIDLTRMPKGTAVVQGTKNDEGQMRTLPSVLTLIRKLGE